MKNLNELIERVRLESPGALAEVDDKAAAKLIRAAFAAVAKEIASAPDGAHKVGALGTFRVRTVEAKAEGKGGGRKVNFRAMAAKDPKEVKAARAAKKAAKGE